MLVKPIIRGVKAGNRWTLDYRHPDQILPHVKTRETLQQVLDFYAHPFIKSGERVPDSPVARRYHVEQVRPALRWLCKKYGVNIPTWLEGNAHYDTLPPEEHEEMFGSEPLFVKDFEELHTQPKDEEE